ncbi:MAG: YggT family protein [bacterium]|nr:YggT family protein [bacterium]
MQSIFWLADSLLSIYFWILILHVILSWLASFNVINTRQPFVGQIGRFLWQVTEPVLAPIRQILRRLFGNLGGIDVSPLIALVLIGFARRLLAEMAISIR